MLAADAKRHPTRPLDASRARSEAGIGRIARGSTASIAIRLVVLNAIHREDARSSWTMSRCEKADRVSSENAGTSAMSATERSDGVER